MVCSNGEGLCKVTIDDPQHDHKPSYIKVTDKRLIEDIFREIAEKYAYQPDEIEIIFKAEEPFTLSVLKNKSLYEAGLWPVSGTTNYEFIVTPKKTEPVGVLDISEDDLILGASASPTIEFATSSCEECSTAQFNYESNGFNNQGRRTVMPLNSVIAESPNYVGLVNQAMTCYLNSLLQALFMTPEFRNALYNWEFDGAHETISIPYQLQRLFLNLQTSTKSAVETTDLTTSFGWQGSDAWHQHDIQELCRVMFDALEQKFKDTKQANLINDLYEGKMLDYVKCLECGTEKSREDAFLDIPLPVRPFGSTVAYNSVEEAIRAFVQPETLDGNNQYFCEKCGKKCDAHKGLKFTKFPYLLTLHLKRFDFDYITMHRIKLNDKVVFPEKLNLNSFITVSGIENEQGNVEGETTIKCDDCSTTDSGSADDESCQGTDLSLTANGQEDNCADSDEGIDVSSGNNHENDAKGPYVYELFSIMIHSGSASGGHYYAYIKDFEKNLWFCFNDQSVNPITEDDIKKTFGGGPQRSFYSGAFSSSTNAYMLMYRQIDKERNSRAMTVNEFPPHIQQLWQNMRQKEEEDKLNRKKEDAMLKISVTCIRPNTFLPKELKISTFSDSTLAEVAQHAYNRFKLDGLEEIKDCRIVVYNKKHKCIDYSFESDEMRMCDVLQKYNLSYSDWMLEIREPGTTWNEYKKGGVNMNVYPINLDTEDIGEPKIVRVDVGETVGEFKHELSQILNTDHASLRVVLQSYNNDPKYFKDDSEVIQIDPNCCEYKLYVANVSDKDPETSKKNLSKLKKVVEMCTCVISLVINLPATDDDVLESLSIPSLDLNQNLDKHEQSGDRGLSSPNLYASPQPGPGGLCGDGYDQSNSEDSSLSDSDRTLIGDAPADCLALLSSSSASPADQHMASPADPCQDTYNYEVMGRPGEEMHWDDGEIETDLHKTSAQNYFKVTNIISNGVSVAEEAYWNICNVLIDKRMTLETLKKNLETILKVPSEYFKLYRQHDELTRLSDTLRSFRDGDRLTVKLGRVLREDEHLFKIFHLKPDNMDPNNFLFEHVITKNQTVDSAKKEILQHGRKQNLLDIPYNRCRLREKSLKKPKKIYLDDQRFGEDIVLSYNFELYLQELSEPETVTSNYQVVVFLRRWSPSQLTLGPFQEAVLDTLTVEDLKKKVSELSGISFENVDISHVKGNYPCDMHLLEIHSKLDWDPKVKSLDQWPMNVEDGCMFFYKDNREALKELTPEEKKEIKQKEDVRLGRLGTVKTYSPGRERALKIYVLDSSPSTSEDSID